VLLCPGKFPYPDKMSLCPKCASTNAWLSADRVDVTLRCLCGFNRVIASLLDADDDVAIEKTALKLPAKGSNLLRTLLALRAIVEGDNSQITARLNGFDNLFKVKDVGSYLYVLKAKGLVRQVTTRKQRAFSSIWRVTEEADVLIQEKHCGNIISGS
jgi:hypothetical protein